MDEASHEGAKPGENDEQETSPDVSSGAEDLSSIMARLSERSEPDPLAVLEEEGFIVRHADDVVCNLDAFTADAPRLHTLRRSFGAIGRSQEKPTSLAPTKEVLMRIFRNLKVYSADDYRRLQAGEDVVPKDLFYTPRDVEAAYDPQAISEADFYLTLSDVKGSHWGGVMLTHDENGESIPYNEANIACFVFHPRFGAGERDEEGRLIVTWRDGRRRPISTGFFRSWGMQTQHVEEGVDLTNNPGVFISRHAEGLISRGLIDIHRDFRIVSGSSTADVMGLNLRRIRTKGMIMVNGVNYTLGAEWDGARGYRFYTANSDVGFIIDDSGNAPVVNAAVLLYTRDTIPESARERLAASNWSYPNIRRSEVTIIKREEMRGEYPAIASLADNFESFVAFSTRVSEEAHASIIGLTEKEQSMAIALYLKYGEDERLWDFVRAFGIDGLKTLMIADGEFEVADRLLDMHGSIPAPFGRLICTEAASILTDVTLYERDACEHIPAEQAAQLDMVTDTIITYTRHLVLSALELQKSRVNHIDEADIIFLLRKFRASLDALYTQYGVKADQNPYLDLLQEYSGRTDSLRIALLLRLQEQWHEAMRGEAQDASRFGEARQALLGFYLDRSVIGMADETTGDTEKEIEQFREFIERDDSVPRLIVDLGCGTGRLTELKAEIVGNEARIIGIDLLPREASDHPNIEYVQGDITRTGLKGGSVDVVTADWSVVNDQLTRTEQNAFFAEVARILKPGGRFKFDVPHLEGGEGSWESVAEAYRMEHPEEPYGTIEAEFSEGKAKPFAIMPRAEIDLLLEMHGFEVDHVTEWKTRNNRPRLTYETRLVQRAAPAQLERVA